MFSSPIPRDARVATANSPQEASIRTVASSASTVTEHAPHSVAAHHLHVRAATADAILPHRSLREARPRVSFAHRMLEVIVASIALIVFAPVMLFVAAIVKLGTPGPVLFRQKRVGLNGKLFTFVKFRTLYSDARQRYPHLYSYKYDADQLRKLKFKVMDDPRVTPQGEWLRKSTLDELPNFWNVLRGDMALVGPRPEIPEMVPYYHGDMVLKFAVRPGVTGLAQVSGRGRLGFHETVDLDVEYVRAQSGWLDFKIVVRTLRIVLLGDGAF
jgi:lipopolysaccharide/colanic/teichoic acid biosynthesis glycosyltransferase